ncbi:MAG TPA: MerR family transcriptional regulator [Methylotenera sp.]|jgi:DNA-binding transcriptional MerR regulator|nr:MerR family transcriptional regulator [Methylotenera sp.]
MLDPSAKVALPPIPAKRYFTIGEVSELCGVKPHVLRYWEQEFTQLKPVKRRGNRRYYQHHEVLLIRKIRELLYEQGFTISGARNRLDGAEESIALAPIAAGSAQAENVISSSVPNNIFDFVQFKAELREVIHLLRA